MQKIRLLPSVIIGFLTLTAPLASANKLEEALFGNKHMLSVGVAEQITDARIGASNPNFDAVELTLDDLGVEDTDYSYYLEYRYRFKPNWSLFAGAYSFNGSGGITNSRDFNYDGVEFTANSELNASLDVDAYIVDVMYRAYASESLEVMLGAGLHSLDLGVAISGQVQVNELSSEFRQSGTTLLAPVPNVRTAVNWAISDRFGMNFVGGWLSANIDDYEGAFLYAHLRGIYRISESVGVSLGYQFTDIDIKQVRSFSEVSYDLQLQGPTLSLSYSF